MSPLKRHNKLVRDRIPEIIEQSGHPCRWRILDDDEYLRCLDAKLEEELAEYLADGSPEELADLLEALYAAAQARGCSREQLEAIRLRKAAERGGFLGRVFLEDVDQLPGD